MAEPLVTDALWAVVAPLLPPEGPKPKGGRPRIPDRAAIAGILFVLKSGIPWQMLPQELGCGSGRVPTEWVLLAALAGLAAGGGVAGGPSQAAGSAGGELPHRLVARRAGLG